MIAFLQKRFNFDLNYFLGGGAWLFAGQVLAAIKSLVISVFLARFFGIEDFGRFAYIMAVFSMANIFGAPGMGIALFQSVARGYEGTIRILTKKVFFIGLLGSFFLVLYQGYFTFVQGEQNNYIFLILALLFPFYSISVNFTYFISGIRRFKMRTYLEFFMNIFILSSVFLTFFLTKDVYILGIVVILSQTMISCAYLYYFMKHANTKVDSEAYEYGRKLNWNYVIPNVKMQLDRVLISNALGYSNTANYNVASSLGDQLNTFSKILGVLIVPKSSNLSGKEIKEKLSWRNISILVFSFFILAGILIVLCPYLIVFLFGKNYTEAVLLAQVILLLIPIRCLSGILRYVHESQKNTKILGIISNQMSIAEIILMTIGLTLFQMWGVIFARALTDGISVALQLAFLYRKEKA